MHNYYRILSATPVSSDYEVFTEHIERELAFHLSEEYESQFADAEIRHFNDHASRSYRIYFDCTQDESDDIYGRSARVVFVMARSQPSTSKRDANRLRKFQGSFNDVPALKGYDKGHYIAHCNDGQLDQNIYPQLKDLNRGLSSQGKLFRAMERYCQNNLGIFYFVRPIYNDLTWIPNQLDFGILTKEKGILLNRFDNRSITNANPD